MNNIFWFLFTITLLGLELIYFRIARSYKILDHPNNRNLHTKPTIRGGGIIFFIAALLYSATSHQVSVYTIAGLTLVSVTGFVDDVRSLSSALRFALQLASIGLMFYGLNLYPSLWMVVALFIICIGALNAFNFMDGINGLTGGYGLVALSTLAYVNAFEVAFADQEFLYGMMIGVLVFCFFNFRTKAVCFAGDVGSLSIGFIIISLLLTLVTITGNWIYLFFLSVYGADTGLTMIHRVMMKENIFTAHRHHLFQVIVHKTGISHVQMSVIYMLVQLIFNVVLIAVLKQNLATQIMVGIGQLVVFAVCYIMIKRRLLVATVTAKGTQGHKAETLL